MKEISIENSYKRNSNPNIIGSTANDYNNQDVKACLRSIKLACESNRAPNAVRFASLIFSNGLYKVSTSLLKTA